MVTVGFKFCGRYWYSNLLVGLCCEQKMNDLFRAIFGIPSNDQYGKRMDEEPSDEYTDNVMGSGGDDDDDDDNMRMNSRGGSGFFGFPFFNDPVDIHKHFERLVEEMNKTFGMFGFGSGPSISWEDENSNYSSQNHDQQEPRQESLRDSFLKQPDCSCDKNINNINLKVKVDDMRPGTSNGPNSESQFSFPKVYSKSVFIQTVRRPDGSVETIKKVRDHTGNEETTITQSNVNDPLPPPQDDPLLPKEDNSGISIFKKFFPF